MPSSATARVLSSGQTQRLLALRKFAQLLDSAVVLPGTKYRIGLDPVLGLIPGIGDLVSPLFTIAILWQARDLGIPRVVQLRMLVNVGIDALLGAVPLIGDLFDFVWKANDRNMALLEQHSQREHRASATDWLFVAAAILVVVALAAIPFVLAAWIIGAVARYLS